MSHRRDSLEFRWPFSEQSSLLSEWHRWSGAYLERLDRYLSSSQATHSLTEGEALLIAVQDGECFVPDLRATLDRAPPPAKQTAQGPHELIAGPGLGDQVGERARVDLFGVDAGVTDGTRCAGHTMETAAATRRLVGRMERPGFDGGSVSWRIVSSRKGDCVAW